jgi:hypothetical protein
MDILILKTNINSKEEFLSVRKNLSRLYSIKECTVDLEDKDKVMRVIGNNLNIYEITSRINHLGFVCDELQE